MHNVFVPLNAFDRSDVLKNGQASFIGLIANSGAKGIEIRRELLSDKDSNLEKIRKEISKYELFTVYSAPIELWKDDYQFNKGELTEVLQEARKLGAKWVKVSLGHFDRGHSKIISLRDFLAKQKDILLLVENDQTPRGGNINHLKAFFESACELNIPVRMTFDSGNWVYSGESVDEALNKLSQYVLYLHLKQVEDGPVTVALQGEGNHSWKTVIKHFPADMVKALEFPIEPTEKIKDYIQLVAEFTLESEVKSCDN